VHRQRPNRLLGLAPLRKQQQGSQQQSQAAQHGCV